MTSTPPNVLSSDHPMVANLSPAGLLGRLVAGRRAYLGLSQRDLGRLAGVSRATISAVESGGGEDERTPHRLTLRALGAVLGLNLEEQQP